MAATAIEDAERALEYVTDLDDAAARSLLRRVRDELRTLENPDQVRADADHDRRQALEHRLEQRLRQVEHRDAYGGELGPAMNPDESNAP